MKRIGFSFILATLLMGSLLLAVALAQATGSPATPAAATTITVDSGQDPDDSKSKTCISEPVCTLRRAIVQSRNLSGSDLPVTIQFDIPESDPSYNSGLDVWELEIYPLTDTTIFRRLKGQLTIDGSTQPGGRTDGPKIIIIGPGTGNKDGLIVGDFAGQDEIVIRGLGFQNLKTHMFVNTANNTIEENWFGLTSNGRQIYLRADEPEDGSGSAGIAFASGSRGNMVRNNVFAGFDGVAIAVRGDDNVVRNNLIGTRADGKAPKPSDPELYCTTVDWLGGGGVSVEGNGHRILNNVIAGLRQEIYVLSNQPDAVRASGEGHQIRDNSIGVDGTGAKVGVCGRGIYMQGADPPEFNLISGNTIVDPRLSAISINGAGVDANTLENNIIKQTKQWIQVEGNAVPEDAIQFGQTVPSALRNFMPSTVTSIDGKHVVGRNGAGSPCPNCIIELYLDDKDAITETKELLATVTANDAGRWSVTLNAPLASNQGIRTTSTTAAFNTIAGMSAGTTTKLSVLYLPAGGGDGSEYNYLPVMMMKP